MNLLASVALSEHILGLYIDYMGAGTHMIHLV